MKPLVRAFRDRCNVYKNIDVYLLFRLENYLDSCTIIIISDSNSKFPSIYNFESYT
ncbi:hypothetical protein N665_0116s0019 [Sinapis alba]|nr:hypothetical protein N665_0116s0019 [Sinapis alba]